MIASRSCLSRVAAICAAPVLLGPALTSFAHAAQPYEGKQVTIVVGNPAGGGYDAYARLLARHIGRHLPGNPVIIVQNMPGAGSLTAAQHLANVAPRDGTVIGSIVPAALFQPLIEDKAKFRYAPGEFEYIGSADSGTRLCLTTKTSGIQTIDDARKSKVVVASTAPQSSATEYATFMNALAGTKFEVVMGYKGPAELLLAMERGEAMGVCALDSATIGTIRPDWIEGGKVNILVQAGLKPNPAIKAPSIWEYIKGDNRAVAELIVGQQEFGRPFLAPPKTPADKVALLRRAFIASMEDPQLQAEVKKMKIGLNYKSGEEVSAIIKKMYDASPDLIARTKRALQPSP